MKLINQNDITNLSIKVKATRPESQCLKDLIEIAKVMEVNQGVLVSKSEWTNKSDPYLNGHRQIAPKKFKTGTLTDNSGWLITRVA